MAWGAGAALLLAVWLAVGACDGDDGGPVDAARDAVADTAGEDARALDAGEDAAPRADAPGTADGRSDGRSADTPDGAGGACETLPSGGLYATFDVTGERFRAHLTSPAAIDGALALWEGTSSANIPNGSLVCEPEPWNCGWSWHLEPGTITFAELTIEVCDGAPSYIEENCDDFVDRYCPWSATLVELRDCRTDPSCPVVPR